MSRWSLVLVAVVVTLSGCHTYLPSSFVTAPVGEDVRLVIDPDLVSDLTEVAELDGGPVPMLRGTLVGRDGDHMLVRVSVAQRQEGFQVRSLDQAIRVPEEAVISTEIRVLDQKKTLGLVAGGTIGAGVLILLGVEAIGKEVKLPSDDPPEFGRVLLSIPIG